MKISFGEKTLLFDLNFDENYIVVDGLHKILPYLYCEQLYYVIFSGVNQAFCICVTSSSPTIILKFCLQYYFHQAWPPSGRDC